MYMSYCRYEGTLSELRACMADVEEHVNEEAEYEVSDREITCFKTLITEIHEFMQNMELIDCEGELDYDELDRVCEAMAKRFNHEEDEYE